MTTGYTVPYRPGLTVGGALASTGVIGFGPAGQIVTISGIPIGGNISYQVRLNGRPIPAALLGTPIQAGDTVTIDLIVI